MIIEKKFEIAKVFFNKGLEEFNKKKYYLAEEFYKKSLLELPDRVSTLTNLSATQIKLGKFKESLHNSKKSIEIDEQNLDGWLNYGSSNLYLKKYNEALDCFQNVLKINNNKIEAIINLAVTYEKIKKYDLAIKNFIRAKEIDKYYEFAYSHYIKLKLKLCDWSNVNEELDEFNNLLLTKKIVASPLISLTTSDDPYIHASCSEKYIDLTLPKLIEYRFNKIDVSKRKINIGYFSSDFRKHAVSYLIRDLFLNHDKSKFNLIGLNNNQHLDDDITIEIKKNFDHFVNISSLSDQEVLKICKEFNLDIAVDLNGYTGDARTGLFNNKIAPIQVNFLGYPGSMHMKSYDYIIVDKEVINQKSKNVFTESLVMLPGTYQINSRRKNILRNNDLKRTDHGLPSEGIVFCCFNRSHKILPIIFNSWMNILTKVEKSVLWLFHDNEISSNNLIEEAKKRGVPSSRIIFAEEKSFDEHIERQKLADIFLDTYPYNAHTTCIDAIWGGLPVVTLQGDSFSSRVASSILKSLNLDDLVTNTFENYESKAIELSQNKEKLYTIKKAINEKKLTSNVFKTEIYTKYLESAYERMIFNYNNLIKNENIIINHN